MRKIMLTLGIVAMLAAHSYAQTESKKAQIAPADNTATMKGKHRGMINDLPDLSETQKVEIQKIRDENRASTEPQRTELKEVRTKLAELKKAENPDRKQIDKLIDRSSQLGADMERSRTNSELKVRAVLTPEQRTALDMKQKENLELRDQRHMEKQKKNSNM